MHQPRRNAAVLLTRYPLLNQSFKQVSQEVESEIASTQQRVKLLEEHAHRSSL
jgi:hypothetical protein